MNILLITQHFDIVGGSDVMVHQTKRLLEQAGHQVYLFAARAQGTADDGIYPGSDHFYKPRPSSLWRFLFSPEARARLNAFLDQYPIDVAHLHIHYGTLTSSILKPLKKRGIRVVQHLHEYRTFCPVSINQRDGETCLDCRVGSYLPGLRHRCNRGSLARSVMSVAEMYVADCLGAKSVPDLFLTVSHFQRDIIVGQGMPGERVQVLHNPVDPMFFQDAPAEARQGVIYAGRVEDYKGIFDFLAVARACPDMSFTVIGDGNAMQDARAQAADLPNVTFTGQIPRPDLLAHLACAIAMIVPSRWNETFGLTAVEAMASGCIPIVTCMGGLPEVVEDGLSGYVVDMGDVAGMIRCVTLLKGNLAQVCRMGANGTDRAKSLFSECRYVSGLQEAMRKENH